MRPELVVGAGAALLIGALAGVEWWAEHQSVGDALLAPVDGDLRHADGATATLPETNEVDSADASASPRLSR